MIDRRWREVERNVCCKCGTPLRQGILWCVRIDEMQIEKELVRRAASQPLQSLGHDFATCLAVTFGVFKAFKALIEIAVRSHQVIGGPACCGIALCLQHLRQHRQRLRKKGRVLIDKTVFTGMQAGQDRSRGWPSPNWRWRRKTRTADRAMPCDPNWAMSADRSHTWTSDRHVECLSP